MTPEDVAKIAAGIEAADRLRAQFGPLFALADAVRGLPELAGMVNALEAKAAKAKADQEAAEFAAGIADGKAAAIIEQARTQAARAHEYAQGQIIEMLAAARQEAAAIVSDKKPGSANTPQSIGPPLA